MVYDKAIIPAGDLLQGNYAVTYVKADFTITKAEGLTLKADDYEGTYDGKLHGKAATASVTDGTTIEYKVGADGTWSSTVPQIKEVGSATVTARARNSNYKDPADVTYTLKVNPAPVTVTALPAGKVYGAADPVFIASVNGMVNGENLSLIHYSISRLPGEAAMKMMVIIWMAYI